MRRSRRWLLLGIFAITVLAISYLDHRFFFNPLTFQRGEITNLPWNSYTNPLQLEYAVLDDDGWKMTTVTDTAEIALVFRELRKGASNRQAAATSRGCRLWLGVRRQGDGAILFSMDGQEQVATCRLRDTTKQIGLTTELQQLLQTRLREARDRQPARACPPEK